jgi:hypothetical protein
VEGEPANEPAEDEAESKAEPEAKPEAEGKSKAAKAEKKEDDGAPDDWDKRQLCSDGTCMGVIGENGKCSECGKSP